MKVKLRTLDVFSGIGCFSHIFHGFHKTVGYCEIDAGCRKVLSDNMKRGRIDVAPIFEDVKALTGRSLVALRPDMITAGFPCQDIAHANVSGKGLVDGEQSSLFFHVLRLADECRCVKLLFLENSENIVNRGFDELCQSLRTRGFRVLSVICSAEECGAPHLRKRWFALAYRGGLNKDDLRKLTISYKGKHVVSVEEWRTEPVDRVVPLNEVDVKACKARCKLLGNSIVPQCLLTAWNMLCTHQKTVPNNVIGNKRPLLKLLCPPQKVTRRFPTPTYTTWHQYRKFTDRGTRAIGNFIYMEQRTWLQIKGMLHAKRITKIPDRFHVDTVATINPEFVEWLMGFPLGWTRGIM